MKMHFFSAMLVVLFATVSANAQVNQDFEIVFGQFAGDGDEPVDGWFGALRSDIFGPTGIIPGVEEACGQFDAQAGSPGSYAAMNYRNVNSYTENDTTSTWLVTPDVSIADRTMLSFYTRTVVASQFPDRLVVRLSTNGDSVDVGSAVDEVGDFQTVLFDINPTHTVGGYPEEWTKYEVELNGLGGGTGRIAFHYFNQFMNVNGHYVGIDTVSVIPFLVGDINCDGTIDLLDVQPFVDLLSNGGFSEKADLNGDGAVTLEDVDPFIEALLSL